MNYIAAGFKQITGSSNGASVQVLADEFIADQEGYIMVYVSNETDGAEVVVSWDDFTIYHGKTNIVQTNDYYPFGLSSTSYARTASLFNPYLYNQSSRLEEETEWYHTPFRKYDASIGRFTGVDALASSMASINSYHYAYNNPVNFSDPAGLSPRPTRDRQEHHGSSLGGGMMGSIMRALGRMYGFIGNGFGGSDNWDGGGGGRMGWSNGTGFNADGSIRYRNSVRMMAAELMARTGDDGGYYNQNGDVVSFESANQALDYGSDYNDYHDSWGNTRAGSKEGAKDNLYTERLLASGLRFNLRYALADCRDCNLFQRWLQSFGQILQQMVPTREALTPLEEDRRLQELVDLNKDAIETNDASVATPLDPNQPLDRGNTNPVLGHLFRLFNLNTTINQTPVDPTPIPVDTIINRRLDFIATDGATPMIQIDSIINYDIGPPDTISNTLRYDQIDF